MNQLKSLSRKVAFTFFIYFVDCDSACILVALEHFSIWSCPISNLFVTFKRRRSVRLLVNQRNIRKVTSFSTKYFFVERFSGVNSTFLIEVLDSIDHLFDIVAVILVIVAPFASFIRIVLKIQPKFIIVLFSDS